MGALEDYCARERQRQLDWLIDYVRIPSISSSPEHAAEVRRCGEWTVAEMERIGLHNGQLLETGGHPVAYAEWLEAPNAPTVLIYGHYDVQPVDPLELWDSPPFEPRIENEIVFARGATDNKGQILAHILGIAETLREKGDVPVNLIVLVEGEEEIGSAHLEE